jgi:hypothetical protein
MMASRCHAWLSVRSLSSIHACVNSHGAAREKKYHVVTTFTNINGITVPPVNKSTIGYFKMYGEGFISFFGHSGQWRF